MKIGIISDTHNRYERVEKALAQFRQRGVERVLHCGDIEDPETVQLFDGTPTDFVFGNCDTDPAPLRRAIRDIGATLHEPFGQLELSGKQIAWIHGHNHKMLNELAHRDQFDYLFYGHTHYAVQHQVGRTLVVNPGALHRVDVKTCIVLDLDSGAIESLAID